MGGCPILSIRTRFRFWHDLLGQREYQQIGSALQFLVSAIVRERVTTLWCLTLQRFQVLVAECTPDASRPALISPPRDAGGILFHRSTYQGCIPHASECARSVPHPRRRFYGHALDHDIQRIVSQRWCSFRQPDRPRRFAMDRACFAPRRWCFGACDILSAGLWREGRLTEGFWPITGPVTAQNTQPACRPRKRHCCPDRLSLKCNPLALS